VMALRRRFHRNRSARAPGHRPQAVPASVRAASTTYQPGIRRVIVSRSVIRRHIRLA
jgi:hypothetical protein